MERKEMKLVYDTLLSAPGMEQQVRIDLRLERKQALFLVAAIEKGLETQSMGGVDPLSLSTSDPREALTGFATGILEKAGLSELYQKLQLLNAKP